MNVAVVCPYDLDRPGGVQQQCLELVAGLRGRGHDAWLVGPGTRREPGRRVVGAALSVPGNRSSVPIAVSPGVVAKVAGAVEGAQVIHIHEPLTPLVGWAALRVRAPIVATFHADPPSWVRAAYRAGSPLLRRLLGRLAAATAVSPVAAAPLRGLIPNLEVVPNGVPVGRYPSGQREGHRVAFLGRDERRKGLDVLLSAWPLVRERVAHAELVVMGARRGERLPGVRSLGEVDRGTKQAQLALTDVLCAPNLGGESFGVVLIEGMAAGCALVVSDLPGFRFVAGEAAWFVPPGDRERLAEALSLLLLHPELRGALHQAGQQRVERFDWSPILSRFEELYARAASGNRS